MKSYSLSIFGFLIFFLLYASFRAWGWKREAEQLIKQLKLISFFHVNFILSKKRGIFVFSNVVVTFQSCRQARLHVCIVTL